MLRVHLFYCAGVMPRRVLSYSEDGFLVIAGGSFDVFMPTSSSLLSLGSVDEVDEQRLRNESFLTFVSQKRHSAVAGKHKLNAEWLRMPGC